MTTISTIVSDFDIENHGSVVLLRPLSTDADNWVQENISDDVLRFGGAVVVEPRYIGPVMEGLSAEGLTYAMR